MREDELALAAPWEREGRERERRCSFAVVFVLLNPYSAAVYCQHPRFSSQGRQQVTNKLAACEQCEAWKQSTL